MKLRYELGNTDPQTIYDITKDTGFFRPDELEIAKDLASETLQKPGEYLFIFADNDDETLAYVCYAEIPGTIGSYDMYWLAVCKKCQRQGIGRMLIEAVEQDIISRGGRLICISTSGSELYTGTRAVYEKTGYTKTAVIKDFYLPGDDQVIYVKSLS